MLSDQEYMKKHNLNLSNHVLFKRRFKKDILDLHKKEFMLGQALKYIKKEKETIDVGASVGLYASAFAECCKMVHCFEAISFVHDQRLQLIKNNFDNIKTYNFAVCDKIGVSNFWLDTKKLGNNSFSNIVDGIPIKVNTTYLDYYDFENIGFLKVDVEGHELDVLNGATELINKERPVCMIEIYPVFNNGPIEKTFKKMWEFGNYKCYYNHRNVGLKPIHDIDHGVEIANSDIKIHDGDFLFVPEEYK